ncbi:mucin-5AC-like [Pseudomyrmex gracilis]|uniref:mucin-5AC-like n=1 Tax=Pseudomyrmex gracilis TaxID=219809 RepID=UPI000995A06D|nr:mucin-5AC-like [Pseudomyrmex gracilis]
MIFAFLITMSGQSGGRRVHLAKLNEQLTCKLCGGYFIDATTIIECLHSFCRSCIVKYLENNKYCPICEVQVHKSRPLLNIRPDHTLQDIVYKLVPGCYQNEMRCRREFYAKHPELCNQVTSPEARGEPIESHIYSPDESLNLSLEYYNPHSKDLSETSAIKDGTQKSFLRRYLRCPAAVTVFHLQKLIRAKYGLSDTHRVDIMYKEEPLCSSYTLMDVMYIYHWRRKVPLHLSYRIFESSSKRIKLSEDNANYKKSITDAGIDSIELKDEKSLKREWKEVQLKISETGVMSITDISNTVHKRDTGIDNLQDDKTSENTITSIIEVNKADSLVENCDTSKPTEMMRPTLVIDAQVTTNPIFPDSDDVSLITIDVKPISENSSKSECCTLMTQQNGNATRQTNEIGNHTVAKSQQDRREMKNCNQAADVKEEKTVLQEQKIIRPTIEDVEENASFAGNKDGNIADKKLSINNNNTDFKTEAQKECAKNISEAKTGNSGSKIDALSVKLQFQPKIGQVNNTYSKKTPKEKRVFQQNTKKSDGKTLMEDTKPTDVKARTTYGNAMEKVSVSCSTATCTQKPIVSAATSQSVSTTDPSSASGKQEVVYDKDNQSTNIDVQQALDLLEQRTTNSSVQIPSAESIPSHATNTINHRSQCSQSSNTAVQMSENIAGAQNNESTSSVKPVLKNSNNNCVPQKLLGASPVAFSTSNNSALSVSQSSTQTSSMSSTLVKNNYSSNDATIITATSTATITTTVASKPASSSGAVPPCPDAIPISLMKQASMRKQEATAKGTNLNELCAKIGSNTIGSKINDICAKIGENSKEKNKLEGRGKLDVPDLLKINTKKSPSLFTSDMAIKHIPNIPNVPVYTPSTSTVQESKCTKSVLPTSTSSNPLAVSTSSSVPSSSSHVTQRMSLKKQNQPMGYKTLRDPPKSWNPTLSKNNYVAVKNQAKEMQIQIASEGTSKQIPSKPAKIFKMRNMPRYLGNPASGVKPMYGVANDTKEKDQSTTNTKSVTLNMMKIDPKTLSPIVSTVNSPIISPPPYSLNARSYQNTPFPRDICRNTGSPISPRNSPVNMLSTNPFIPSPTPNTNPRIIYSPFPPPFPDASRFPSPLIRSPINIPPPSAFHSSLPPSINKLYQRSSYIPQTTGYSPVSSGQPPAVQRIPPTHSSSPKSPKTSSPSSISSFNLGKAESQPPITSTVDSVALLLSKSMPIHSLQRGTEPNAFNLSKTGSLTQTSISNVVETSSAISTKDAVTETQAAIKQTSSLASHNSALVTNVDVSENLGSQTNSANERKQSKDAAETQETARCKEESSKPKLVDTKCVVEIADNTVSSPDKKEKNQAAAKINGDVTTEQFAKTKSKENNGDETTATTETTESGGQDECSSLREHNNPKNNAQANVSNSPMNISKNEDLGKTSDQIQGKKSEVQRNKAET